MTDDLAGLWVPTITPMTADGAVDAQALRRLSRRLLDDGCRGWWHWAQRERPPPLATPRDDGWRRW